MNTLNPQQLLEQARQKCLDAERLRVGSGAYNLACVEARLGNTTEAIRWLQAHQSAGVRNPKAQIAAEKDFDRIRNEPEFVTFLESLTPT